MLITLVFLQSVLLAMFLWLELLSATMLAIHFISNSTVQCTGHNYKKLLLDNIVNSIFYQVMLVDELHYCRYFNEHLKWYFRSK